MLGGGWGYGVTVARLALIVQENVVQFHGSHKRIKSAEK